MQRLELALLLAECGLLKLPASGILALAPHDVDFTSVAADICERR